MTVKYDLKRTKLALDSLSIYRQLLDDSVISKFYSLMDYIDNEKPELSVFINLYNNFFYTLSCKSQGYLKDYIIDKIIFDENPYSKAAANKDLSQKRNLLQSAASKNLVNLQIVSNVTSVLIKDYAKKSLCKSDFEMEIVEDLPEWIIEDEYYDEFSSYSNDVKSIIEKFIIFIDDLSFEDSGENYNTLKAVIEGGLENRPSNVLIYATSNRRHLIKNISMKEQDFKAVLVTSYMLLIMFKRNFLFQTDLEFPLPSLHLPKSNIFKL